MLQVNCKLSEVATSCLENAALIIIIHLMRMNWSHEADKSSVSLLIICDFISGLYPVSHFSSQSLRSKVIVFYWIWQCGFHHYLRIKVRAFPQDMFWFSASCNPELPNLGQPQSFVVLEIDQMILSDSFWSSEPKCQCWGSLDMVVTVYC